MRPTTEWESAFKIAAALLILTWAAAVFGLWLRLSLKSIEACGELVDIPGGLAAVIAALTAGAGWNRYVSYRERKQ